MKTVVGFLTLFLLFIHCSLCLCAQTLHLDTLKLMDARTGQVGLLECGRDKTMVLFFLSPECPLCRNYTRTILSLQKAWRSSVVFAGIFPGTAYEAAEIEAFGRRYQLTMDLLIDPRFTLTNSLNVKITPTAVLLKNGKVMYFGAIDNWLADLGKKRIHATAHYLQDALEDMLRGRPVRIPRVEPKGCLVNVY